MSNALRGYRLDRRFAVRASFFLSRVVFWWWLFVKKLKQIMVPRKRIYDNFVLKWINAFLLLGNHVWRRNRSGLCCLRRNTVLSRPRSLPSTTYFLIICSLYVQYVLRTGTGRESELGDSQFPRQSLRYSPLRTIMYYNENKTICRSALGM